MDKKKADDVRSASVRRNAALVASIPQLILGTVFFLVGWLFLDRFNSELAKGVAVLLVGTLMINGAMTGMIARKCCDSLKRADRGEASEDSK